ncbi:MAG: hypothetical protein RH982_11000 [Parvibaculum sp.]
MDDTTGQHRRALLATSEKQSCLVVTPPKQNEGRRTYVVLGVERGGTSMVAGVIRALGVNMGVKAGLNHEDPRFITEDFEKQSRIIRQNNKQNDVWGFKVPKAALSLDFYAEHLRNPYYVVVYRNIAAIADSWHQRGTGSYLGAIERTVRYYAAISDFMQKTNRPLLIVNYERATEMREQTVASLASFVGVEPDGEMTDRCVEMITGDGKGYVNLPEHHFRVSPVSDDRTAYPDEGVPISVADNAKNVVESDGWVSFDSPKKRMVFVQPGEAPFPTHFWMELDLDVPDSMNLEEDPVRIYFNYTGQYFPGHCARPRLRRGRNRLFVETSGKARGVAVGPLRTQVRMKISAKFYSAETANAGLLSPAEAPGE